MKLYTFKAEGRPRVGIQCNGFFADLALAARVFEERFPDQRIPRLPPEMTAFLRLGKEGLDAARQVEKFLKRRPALPVEIKINFLPDEVELLPPLLRPGKMLFAGTNFHGHLTEKGTTTIPDEPFFFSKLSNTLIATETSIKILNPEEHIDVEVELAVVIGRQLFAATTEEATAAIVGYTIINDVTNRTWQYDREQLTLSKNFDTFCPMGPALVTADEFDLSQPRALRSWVNGELLQDSTTADWIFPAAELISRLSQVLTLEPGDVISTGTPAGSGYFRKPKKSLQPGDIVEVEVHGLGKLRNPVALLRAAQLSNVPGTSTTL
jgi:2-keto-4-pentenoate hydratase/2-oxohepta-3-ene-1,7-dioic acid hydratase in catechol pathway